MSKLKYVKLFENFTNEDFFENSEWFNKISECKNKTTKQGDKELPGVIHTKKGPESYEWFFEPFTTEERKKLYNTPDYKRPENYPVLDSMYEEKYKYSLKINKLSEDTNMVSDKGIERGGKSPFRASITEWKEGGKNHTLLDDFMIKNETLNVLNK
jgi:hypothetical protein